MDVRRKVESLFPRRGDVPADMDFASGAGVYDKGTSYLIDGEIKTWNGSRGEVLSPVCTVDGGKPARRLIGPDARLDRAEALRALDAAVRAWDQGRGKWPTMRVGERAERLQEFTRRMRAVREESVRLLMWEIGKTFGDSQKEFDRTVQYVADTIEALKETDRAGSRFSSNGGVLAHIRRAPLGVVLCMGPFNYPLNETFTTLIPALAMGNTVVAKLPRFGALCQAPLLAAFADCFPPGVINIVNGERPGGCGPRGGKRRHRRAGVHRQLPRGKRSQASASASQPAAMHPRPGREESRHRAGGRGPGPRRLRMRDGDPFLQRAAVHGPQAPLRPTQSRGRVHRQARRCRGRAAVRHAVGEGRPHHAASRAGQDRKAERPGGGGGFQGRRRHQRERRARPTRASTSPPWSTP